MCHNIFYQKSHKSILNSIIFDYLKYYVLCAVGSLLLKIMNKPYKIKVLGGILTEYDKIYKNVTDEYQRLYCIDFRGLNHVNIHTAGRNHPRGSEIS